MAVTPQAQSKTDEQKQKGIIDTENLQKVEKYRVGSLAPWSDSNTSIYYDSKYNSALDLDPSYKPKIGINQAQYNQYIKSSPASSTNTGKFLGLDAAGWGQAFDIARSVLPENRAYQGEEGNLARGLDTAYNGLSDAVSIFGPVGTLAGTIMKGGAFLNQGIAALGGGTDGMTKTDAILNSNFLGLTPLGLINGLAGSRADKYSRDSLIDAETNGSYGGFLNLEDESDKVSGKKYGLFSQGAKNAANNLVQNTTAQQISLGNIEDTNRTNLMAAQGNTPFISNRVQLDYSGGVRQAQIGREGLKFAKRVISKARVKKVLDESTNKTVTIPTNLTDDQKMGREPITTTDGKAVYMTGDGNVISKIKKAQEGGSIKSNTRSLEELIEYAKQENPEFIQRMNNSPITVGFVDSRKPNIPLFGTHYMTQMDNIVFPTILPINGKMTYIDDPKEAFGIAYNTNNYLAFDSPEEATLFTTQYKKGWPDFFKKYEEQGDGHTNFWDIPEGSMTASQHAYFKDGGKVNVIPEGALHVHKHHLEEVDEKFEDVTNKGIPVVTEDKDGGLVQQAEVEKEEIIFRLDVTKKLEELKKKGTDEAAIEAGKLLVHEILHNTVDNADLIEKTN